MAERDVLTMPPQRSEEEVERQLARRDLLLAFDGAERARAAVHEAQRQRAAATQRYAKASRACTELGIDPGAVLKEHRA
jgi:hypothetical protein